MSALRPPPPSRFAVSEEALAAAAAIPAAPAAIPAAGASSAFSTGEREPSGAAEIVLAPRELEVLRSIAQGHTQQETAYELGIGVQTVKNYRSIIYRKAGDAESAIDALRYFGWLRLPEEWPSEADLQAREWVMTERERRLQSIARQILAVVPE